MTQLDFGIARMIMCRNYSTIIDLSIPIFRVVNALVLLLK